MVDEAVDGFQLFIARFARFERRERKRSRMKDSFFYAILYSQQGRLGWRSFGLVIERLLAPGSIPEECDDRFGPR